MNSTKSALSRIAGRCVYDSLINQGDVLAAGLWRPALTWKIR